MKKRFRFIVCHISRVGWILAAALITATGTVKAHPAYGNQDPAIGLLQSSEAVIYARVNEERAKHGLMKLEWASDVAEVAHRHSEDMAVKEYFAHVNQEGELLETRLKNAGVVVAVSAENLFKSNRFEEIADESVRRWMNSPEHRKNLLNPDVTDTGIGLYRALEGNDYYITQVFIKRALKVTPAPSRLSPREIDTIFEAIKTSIDQSRYDFNYSSVKQRILKELNRIGMPAEENIYIEGLLKDIPVLGLTADIIAGDGFIVKFSEGDPDTQLELYSRLVHTQGYSAAVFINAADGEVRFPLIKIK